MAKSDVKLLGAWPSPFVNRVVMALKIKAVEYEFVETNYEKSELLLKTNPVHKKIPVLIHADRPICESLIIVQYIDDAWTNNGPPLLPSNPYDRATARFWAAFIDDKLCPILLQIREAKEEDAKRVVFEKLFQGLGLLEEAFVNCSKGKGFFGGDNIGYIDIALGSYVGWIRLEETITETTILDEIKTPHLVEWAERLYSDSCVKDVVQDPRKLLEVYMKRLATQDRCSSLC